MSEMFPYQLVGFLDKEPSVGEPDLLESVQRYCSPMSSLVIEIGDALRTERMPARVLEGAQTPELMGFHTKFIKFSRSTCLALPRARWN